MASLSLPQLALCSYLKQSHSPTHNHTTSAKRLELGAHLGPDPRFLSKQQSQSFHSNTWVGLNYPSVRKRWLKKRNASKVIRWTCVERHQISSIKHHMLRYLAAVSSVLLSTTVSCLCPEATWKAVFCILCWQKWGAKEVWQKNKLKKDKY